MGRQQRYDRTETVEKAMNLFWKNGFSGTSMRDLETCLDMRPGSIYANFGNKELLYLETMELYASKTFNEFQYHMRNSETFMAGLNQFIKQILFNDDGPCACMLAKTLADINPDHEALREKADHMIVNFENILVTALNHARVADEISENCDVRALARFIQVQIIGLRSYAEMQPPPAVTQQLRHDILTAIKARANGIQ